MACRAAIALILLYLLYKIYQKEGLVANPDEKQKRIMAQEIAGAKEVFTGGSLTYARNKLPWIDNVTYEDARNLVRYDRFNEAEIRKIL